MLFKKIKIMILTHLQHHWLYALIHHKYWTRWVDTVAGEDKLIKRVLATGEYYEDEREGLNSIVEYYNENTHRLGTMKKPL